MLAAEFVVMCCVLGTSDVVISWYCGLVLDLTSNVMIVKLNVRNIEYVDVRMTCLNYLNCKYDGSVSYY